MGVPLNHPFIICIDSFSIVNHPFGVSPFVETPIWGGQALRLLVNHGKPE